MTIPIEIQRAMREARAAAANPKPLLSEMLELVMAQAWEAERMQLRLLITGDRDEPYAPELRKVAVLDACAGFLRACIDQPDEVARRLRAKAPEGAGK